MDTLMGIESSAFGVKLKAFRAAAGLTLAELAERSGLNLYGIAKIESGGRPNPSWETVCALAAALGKTPNDFLTGDEPVTPAAEADDQPQTRPAGKRK